MQEAKKNVILRVFRTAHCPPGKYFFGVTCSALSVLLSGVPFYTVYRIIRLFLLASLDGAAAPTHEIWMWAAVTIGSIVLGIVLSVIGSFSCHACAFNALYDLRMRLLDHMGRLNLGFYTGGQSGATQKMMNENIEKMENIIAHDVSNIFGAYKTITISVLAFLLVSGCALLYLHPGDHELMMELLMFLIVGPACISPLMELVEFGADLRNLAVRMDQIDEVLNMQPISEGTETAPKGGAEIVFQDVSFSYQNAADPLRRMALDHLTIKIPAGSFAALVGPSGGGKSTAGQLIARFWDVESGSITIAGHDIREYSMEALMNAVAFVFQDTHIFAESVYDNIAMHRKVHREDVEKAAKAARCHDFILSLPNGYDTKLGDGGHKLSGGEAQRIAIARAILKDAPIVVLDEAMAFTDAENELALREGMAELLYGKTVLMIAHRLYSIQDADCIFVLENGQLREQGSHTELLKANGLYAHLWAIQNETESWQMKGGVSHA